MPDRTTTSIGLKITTRDQFRDYRKALQSQFGRKASVDVMLIAFMEGVPLAHAAYMVDAYNMKRAESDDEDDEGY